MTHIEEMRARILARANPKPLPVDIPAWGRVWVRVLTVADVDQAKAAPDDKLRIARSAARVLCTEDGTLLFDSANEADVQAIATLPWIDLEQVLQRAGQSAEPPVDAAQGNG
jgi:hypothetical protein